MIDPVEVTPPPTVRFYEPKVMLAYPHYKSVHPLTAFSTQQLADKRRTSACLNYGDAFIVHTRNTIGDIFLRSKSEWLLTVDDDMVVPFGNATWFNANTGFNLPEPFSKFNTLDRLMSHNKTLVGALYFGRWSGAKAMYSEGMDDPAEGARARRGPVDKIQKTKWCGTGCLLIHRSVFEDIEKRFPCLARKQDGKGGQWFTSSEHNLLDNVHRAHKMLGDGPMTGEKALSAYAMLEKALADARTNSGLGVGEDVIFCRRALAAGHSCYVDLGLICGHVGHCVFGPHNTGL